MTNNIKQNEINNTKIEKVGNYNRYVHNPDPEHIAENKYAAEEAIKDIRQHLDFAEDNYIKKFNDALEDSNNISKYIEYVSTDSYMKTHYKSKDDPRFEETYFNKQLEKIANIMLHDYDNQNGEYADRTLLSEYAMKQDRYRNVAIETDGDAEGVKRGLAIHADLLDNLDQGDQKLELSERDRRNRRYADVRANLDKYPDLKQMYEEWEQMGYNYGLHSAYTQEVKEIIREEWLRKFNNDMDNPHSPENRLRLINQQRNQLGYDMHLALESMRNPIHNLSKINHADGTTTKNDVLELLEDTLDLTNVDHVVALLDIQKESRKARVVGMDKVQHVNNWYFILNELENKHKADRHAGGINAMLYQLLQAIKLADMDDYQQEIVNAIRCSKKWLNELESDYTDMLLDNPFKMIMKLLEDKYGLQMDMRQLRAEIRKIARVIADTYDDVVNGRDSKECVSCEVSKMPSAFTGSRAVCNKCFNESVKKVV